MMHIDDIIDTKLGDLTNCGLKNVDMRWSKYALVTCLDCLKLEIGKLERIMLPDITRKEFYESIRNQIKALEFERDIKKILE